MVGSHGGVDGGVVGFEFADAEGGVGLSESGFGSGEDILTTQAEDVEFDIAVFGGALIPLDDAEVRVLVISGTGPHDGDSVGDRGLADDDARGVSSHVAGDILEVFGEFEDPLKAFAGDF